MKNTYILVISILYTLIYENNCFFRKKMHNILVSTILANIQYLRESNRSTSAVETCHLEQQRYKLQQKITRSLH
jgi:hypothetical protein